MSAEHADSFRFFAAAAAQASPLYAALAERIAEDAALLALAARIPLDKLPPNMLFAAVHALLLEQYGDDPLAAFYRSLTERPRPPAEAFADFRRFCLAHAVEIAVLCRVRRTSTNEVQRAAVLMPAFAIAARAGTPLQVIEIGCAAGLLLGWDRIGYDYGAAGRVHHPFAQFTLECAAEGALPLPAILPPVQTRTGLDLVSLDPGRRADALWLRALIWPEQTARRVRLELAIRLARQYPPKLLQGDALALLPRVFEGLPRAGTVLVFHSFALAQFPADARVRLLALLEQLGGRRALWRVGLEHHAGAEAHLTLQRHGAGEPERLLAAASAHGERLRWLEPPTG